MLQCASAGGVSVRQLALLVPPHLRELLFLLAVPLPALRSSAASVEGLAEDPLALLDGAVVEVVELRIETTAMGGGLGGFSPHWGWSWWGLADEGAREIHKE